jgi:ubiquinone/menaquinone biosynthesis C-methylase UbiE
VTALDLAPVVAVTRRAVAAAGCADRYDYISGDIFDLAIAPATYDLVLLGNLCHLFDAATNRKLLRRLRPALHQGGRLAVIDTIPSQDEAAQRSIRLYGVGLMTRTSTGGVHDESSYLAWCAGAGFRETSVRAVTGTPPVSIVMGYA